MARETQKAKIERLEKELERLRADWQKMFWENVELQKKVNEPREQAEQDFLKSPCYQQMLKEIEVLKNCLSLKEEHVESVKKRSELQAQKITELTAQVEELTVRLNEQPVKIHNERGAGRTHKLTPEEVERLKELRTSGLSMREIARTLNCSASLVHKLIHELDNNC